MRQGIPMSIWEKVFVTVGFLCMVAVIAYTLGSLWVLVLKGIGESLSN